MKFSKTVFLGILFFIVGFSYNSFAADTWVGGLSIVWTTPGNWSTGAVPTNADDVIIPAGTPFAPNMNTNNTVYHSRNLTINAGATLTFSNSGALTYYDIYGDVTVNGTLNQTSNKYIFMNKVGGILSASGNVSTCHIYFWNASTTTLATNVTLQEIYIYNNVGTSLSLSSFHLKMTGAINQYGTVNLNTGWYEDMVFAQVITATRLNHQSGTFQWNISGSASSGTWNVQDNDYYNVVFTCGAPYAISFGNPVTDLTCNGSFTIDVNSTCSQTAWPTPIVLRGANLVSNWINNGTYTRSTETVSFTGTGNQSLGGANSTTFNNLTVNNTGGVGSGVTMNTAATVANIYTATAGEFHLNSLILTVSNPAIGAMVSGAGYIVSENNVATNPSIVKWITGTTAGIHTIPFGTGGSLLPVDINVTAAMATAADYVQVATRHTSLTNNNPRPGVVTQMYDPTLGADGSVQAVVDRWWEFTWSANATAVLTLRYLGATENTLSAPYNAGNIGTQYWTTAWLPDNSAIGSAAIVGAGVGVSAAASISFTAGSYTPVVLSSTSAPLPIELSAFAASCSGGNVLLDWQTASELNNDYFTIERSEDGQNFNAVGTVNGSGSTSQMHGYSFTDVNRITAVTYYRLRQTDFNGVSSKSTIIAVNPCGTTDSYDAFNSGDNINVVMNVSVAGDYVINVIDIQGRIISSDHYSSGEGENRFEINGIIPVSGIYLVSIIGPNDKTFTKRIFVQKE